MCKKFLSLILCIILSFSVFSLYVSAEGVKPSTWTAVDGLGRTLSPNSETAGEKKDKFVGMFY